MEYYADAAIRFDGTRVVAQHGCELKRVRNGSLQAWPEPAQIAGGVFNGAPADEVIELTLDAPTGARGWMALELLTRRAYLNGSAQEPELVTLVELPDIGRLVLGLPVDQVSALILWQRLAPAGQISHQAMVVLPEIPGPERYHFLIAWDAERGILTLHMNGVCMAEPDVQCTPWKAAPGRTVRLRPAFFDYRSLEVGGCFVPASAAGEYCPAELRQRRSELLGKRVIAPVIDVEARGGELLYSCPLNCPEHFSEWLVDSGRVSFVDGWLRVASEAPESRDPNAGHTTFWCPFEAPDSFVAEWDFRLVEEGLAITFFATRGIAGESPFDPRLPERHGEFIYYIKDRLLSYHTSYYSCGRGITNLRKNNRFWLIGTGKAGIPHRSRDVHRLRLVKDEGHIQVLVDDGLILDCVDRNEERYGPRHTSGWLGFRQMRPGTADYRNLTIRTLHPTP